MRRCALLEHIGAPEDPKGLHYDLLIEVLSTCRSWRLSSLPHYNGEGCIATITSPHQLAWLEKKSGAVSGNRGWAKRVAAGWYRGNVPIDPFEPVKLTVIGMKIMNFPNKVTMSIENGFCRISP